jgi:glutamyl-tRNA reductase
MGENRQKMTAAIRTTPETAVGLRQIVNARVTYRNAPMHLLEKFTFKGIDEAHKVFLERAGFEECVILQTCNRVEVFGVVKEPDEDRLLEQWVSAVGLSEQDLESIEINKGNEAIEHLMRLAAGLESLVVGEDQILGQVRRAFEF